MRNSVGKLSVVFFTMLFIGINVAAQTDTESAVEKLFTEAQQQYSDSNYVKTIEICTQILEINDSLVGAEMLLSYVYDDIKKPELELYHLNKAAKLNSHPYIKWRLGELYYKLGNYSEALIFYDSYSSYKYISEKKRLTLACKRASCIFNIQSLKDYSGENTAANPNDIYWPTPSSDGKRLIFIQENGSNNESENSFVSNSDSLLSEVSNQFNNPDFSKTENIEVPINNEIIFFTGHHREDGFGDDDIYFSRYTDGRWSAPTNAGSSINSEKSDSQPFFADDEKYLYFSSNRSGGEGERDIWRAKLTGFADDGSPIWESIENLSVINSSGNEISPFYYSKTRQLYFASDSYFGMGGYDLYEATVNESGSVGEFINLGYPINTKSDELGLVVNIISDTAFFTSARTKGEGLEIFAFNLTRGLHTQPNFYVHFKAINQNSKLPVQTNIEIVEQNNTTAEKEFESVNEDGELLLCLKANRSYQFSISEKGYMFYSQTVALDKSNSISNPLEFNIELEPIEIGTEINLYNIYYETNSYAILPESESELNRLVLFLNNNKGVKLEIQGHTDSSGNSENNMQLSKSRAKSVVDYLVEKGINSSVLKYIGYGDTVPIASNETEEGRRLNRRTTIKIIEK